MSFSTINICISVLVLLSIHSAHSRPRGISKRAIIDYINPAVISPIEFERGGTGKVLLKKENLPKKDSSVNYLEDEVAKDKKTIEGEAAKEKKAMKDEAIEDRADVEGGKSEEAKTEEKPALKPDFVGKVSENARIEADAKASYTPVDTKSVAASKPDSKDETAGPTVGKDEKVAIGEVPEKGIVPIPDTYRVPVLIPIRHISFGTVSILPLSPVSGSDRLPMPYDDDDEIVGEGGHESEPMEDSSAEKEAGLPLGDPYVPALPFTGSFLKDLKEASGKKDAEKQTRVVDVFGKKFVMQSNILKYPRGDTGHTFIRFMSIKPLEDEESREVEDGLKKGEAAKDIEKKETLGQDEASRAKETEKELEKEPLKAEETLVKPKTESALEKAEDSFKGYEDPYLKGMKEVHKQAFEGAMGEGKEGEGKADAEEVGKMEEGVDAKDAKKVGRKNNEMKSKKENGKAEKKRKYKCEESVDEE